MSVVAVESAIKRGRSIGTVKSIGEARSLTLKDTDTLGCAVSDTTVLSNTNTSLVSCGEGTSIVAVESLTDNCTGIMSAGMSEVTV